MTVPTLPAPLPALLAGAIDYAGLFPPAALSMADAVASYAGYRVSPDRAALGRFIVPAARLIELVDATDALGPIDWQLSVTLGPDLAADIDRLAVADPRIVARGMVADSLEARVGSAADVERLARAGSNRAVWYGEVAPEGGWLELLDAIGRAGGRAKIRMGGVTAEAFPAPATVAGFLVAVVERNLPFKATAGLHHPIRGGYRLTYAADAPTGTMYGYLNLMAAVTLAQRGAPLGAIEAALRETDPRRLAPDGRLGWDGQPFDARTVDRLRSLFDGFGSCSFREPMDELPPALGR